MLKTANTPDGIVVREITSCGESAWRFAPSGAIARCLDHKGPWVTATPGTKVPDHIRAAFDGARRLRTPE